MINFELFDKIAEVKKYYSGTKYDHLIPALEVCLKFSEYAEAEKVLNKFPTKAFLLDEMVEKLKGKSVYKSLKRISENKITNNSEMLKGLFSLGTHISIEVGKGNKEYSILYPLVYEKIGKILYRS